MSTDKNQTFLQPSPAEEQALKRLGVDPLQVTTMIRVLMKKHPNWSKEQITNQFLDDFIEELLSSTNL